MLMVLRLIIQLTIPVLATAVSIETKYKETDLGGLISTFVAVTISHEFLEQLRSAGMLNTEPGRAKALANLRKPYLFVGGRSLKRLLLLIIIGQAVVPILLWQFAGWSLLSK